MKTNILTLGKCLALPVPRQTVRLKCSKLNVLDLDLAWRSLFISKTVHQTVLNVLDLKNRGCVYANVP